MFRGLNPRSAGLKEGWRRIWPQNQEARNRFEIKQMPVARNIEIGHSIGGALENPVICFIRVCSCLLLYMRSSGLRIGPDGEVE
jgi:hypothetical protein